MELFVLFVAVSLIGCAFTETLHREYAAAVGFLVVVVSSFD